MHAISLTAASGSTVQPHLLRDQPRVIAIEPSHSSTMRGVKPQRVAQRLHQHPEAVVRAGQDQRHGAEIADVKVPAVSG